MIRSASFVSVAVFAVVATLGACSKGGGASPVTQQDGAPGLQALFEASHAACAAKDYQQGRSLTLSMIPGKDHLAKVMKDDVPGAITDKILAQFKELPADDAKVSCLFSPPGRTEIRVHGATTQDINAGAPTAAEFPGGARRLAAEVLRPDVTFYEVEVTEPGKDAGTKFHLFFWDGAQWRMLGPAWRALSD